MFVVAFFVLVLVLGLHRQDKYGVVCMNDRCPNRSPDLVASVINPDHKMSRRYDRSAATTNSPMVPSNTVMTVQELIDLVAFLQEEYEIKTPRTWSEK